VNLNIKVTVKVLQDPRNYCDLSCFVSLSYVAYCVLYVYIIIRLRIWPGAWLMWAVGQAQAADDDRILVAGGGAGGGGQAKIAMSRQGRGLQGRTGRY